MVIDNKLVISRITFFFTLLAFSFLSGKALAVSDQESGDSHGHDHAEEEELNVGELILHHVTDDHAWHIVGDFTIHLPVIIYSSEAGLKVFSSKRFYHHHEPTETYQGYRIDHGDIVSEDSAEKVYDLSITKNVASLFLSAFLTLIIFLSVARGYKRNKGRAPKGIQSLFEPIIIFVRDDIVKPNVGPKYERFLPYLLTLFFFIWFNNLLGLTPGAANLSGNIAVTSCLALITFVVTNVNGNKEYWKHIFNTPGVPWWMKFPIPLMPLVEFIGIFTKPFSLLLRLFVSITAGHIVILSLISLVFIFQSISVGVVSSIFVTFINLIELLVATIQAYVFTLFSSMYIGMAIADHHHDEEDVDKALI